MANTAKYEFTGEIKTVTDTDSTEHIVGRIRALRNINPPEMAGCVSKGDLGGWIETEKNLSHSGECWVDEEAVVVGNVVVKDDAYVCGFSSVEGNAIICDQAAVDGDEVIVGEYAIICGSAYVLQSAHVFGHVTVKGSVVIKGCALLTDKFTFTVDDVLLDQDVVDETNKIIDDVYESGRTVIDGNICIKSSVVDFI